MGTVPIVMLVDLFVIRLYTTSMTRDQLIAKRKAKKQRRLIAAAGGAVAVVIVVFLATRAVVTQPKKRVIAQKAAPVVEEYETDTAVRKELSSAVNANIGWNINDSGWFYMNDDNTIFANGWKTLDGQRYFFKDNGYLATGWTNTGGVKDVYFDETGIIDPSKYQKLVALTYDDGPSESSTPNLLDALEKYGQKATFFVVGEQAELYPEIVKRAYDMGMEIGSHTYDHPWLNQLSPEEIEEEMDHNDRVLSAITGEGTDIMRPTGGGISANLINSVGRPMIQWDLDTLDWDHQDADKTYQRIVDNVQDGSIILMHDLFKPAGDAADRILEALTNAGYKCVTVSELAEAYGYEMEPGGQYYAFYPDGCDQNKTKAEGLENPTAAWDD